MTDSMLRSTGLPIADVLATLLVTLRTVARDGGTLVSHGLEFDAGTVLEEYRRLDCLEGAHLLTQLAQAGACTFGMAYALKPSTGRRADDRHHPGKFSHFFVASRQTLLLLSNFTLVRMTRATSGTH